MRKLISIIRDRQFAKKAHQNLVVNERLGENSQSEKNTPSVKSNESFLAFPYRREKLKRKVCIQNVKTDASAKVMFAKSNFEGTQFVIKREASQGYGLSSSSDKDNSVPNGSESSDSPNVSQSQLCSCAKGSGKGDCKQNQNSKDNKVVIEEFRSTISGLNQHLEQLYRRKKSLTSELPFEGNIDLAFAIFGLSLLIMTVLFFLFYKGGTEGEQSFQAQFLLVFLIGVILLYTINAVCGYRKPYCWFNFDYEAIRMVSVELTRKNEDFFIPRGFKLVCDIEMTWIMLRLLESTNKHF